ncbi:MAG: hypothetical protein I8H86_06300 [Sphingomonadaceae bacterium]|nr:hypothetical protein [Sphingomonadaceae bacterium]
MTNEPEALTAVEPCDREAAADTLFHVDGDPFVAHIREGFEDESYIVQAFARHRIAALSTPDARMLAGEGEAVAWVSDEALRTLADGYSSSSLMSAVRKNHFCNPLYAHPPAAEPVGLREAAQAIIDFDETEDKTHEGYQRVVQGLKAALATPARTDDAGVGGERDYVAEKLYDDLNEILSPFHWEAWQAALFCDLDHWPEEDEQEAIARGVDGVAVGEHYQAWSDDVRAKIVALFPSSPAPDRGEGEAERIERAAEWLHNEGSFDDAWPDRTWPEHPGDTGQRDGGFVKIVPSDVQAKFREVATRMLRVFPSALKPADATPAGEAVQMADRFRDALEEIADHYTDTGLAAKHMAAIASLALQSGEGKA